ncbi:DUF1697 domain-containing protein [Candidatus Saccharibacteria bacterium]|nr:DUF1697 domain-containing protein [Candidatus Saccharibacteria bacterium]
MNKTEVFVALLRGINVGGNNKVEMAKLKAVFESLGFTEVKTYINSGNVVFADSKDKPNKEQLIEKAIKQEFGYSVPVVIRTQAAIEMLLNKVPNEWANDANQKTDVMFLWDEVDDPEVVKVIDYNPEFEHILYVPGSVVWNVDREHIKQGSGIKLIGTKPYRKMTARNINTVRKLAELMKF